MKLFWTEIRIDKTKVIKFRTKRYSYTKEKTKLSLSLFLSPCEKSRDRVGNKTRSVNNADATALELIYTQRKRHGHVRRA